MQVVVIGAGVTGLCAADELARRGVDVHVLEQDHPGAGSTGLTVGVIETQYLEALEIELRVRSMERFATYERDGLPVTRCGYLRLGHDDETRRLYERSVELQRDLGVADAVVLDPDGVARVNPLVRTDDVVAGLYGPSDGYVDGYQLAAHLAERATAAGATIVRARVTGRHDAHARIGLATSAGDFAADLVVNASGPWAAAIGDLLGAPVPVSPQRHQAVALDLGKPLPYVLPFTIDYVPRSGRHGVYLRSDGSGRLIGGLHTDDRLHEPSDPDAFARTGDDDFVAAFGAELANRFPRLPEVRVRSAWAGLYPMPPGDLPLVGPHPADGRVICAVGSGGVGIQLGPALGLLCADWATAGAPSIAGAAALVPPP